jgi:predicted Fe-S protein YdhL (DUF1289 family)
MAGTSSMSARPSEAPVSEQKLPERPDTPCVAVCSTTFDEICRGCGRTVVEVAHWVSMTPEAKEAVWVRILAQGYPRRNT